MSPYDTYLGSLIQQFWNYMDAQPPEVLLEMESTQRDARRPPVFKKSAVARNILIPPTAAPEFQVAVVATLPEKERHRHFGSLRSSQVLVQSVFGNLIAAGKTALLEGLETEEGLPAFFDDIGEASLQLEYAVDHLGEPRSTSIDLWVEGFRRVAVECKLTETEFGSCSRPRLRPSEPNYARDHCDGSYTQQRGRETRCALTEIGDRYWTYIPELFVWRNLADLRPCPLDDTYQLIRNVLAACVTRDGKIDSRNAHALAVYDARNPAYQKGGKAHEQWLVAKTALRDPHNLRTITWQRLIAHLSRDSDLAWLCDALNAKYGFGQKWQR